MGRGFNGGPRLHRWFNPREEDQRNLVGRGLELLRPARRWDDLDPIHVRAGGHRHQLATDLGRIFVFDGSPFRRHALGIGFQRQWTAGGRGFHQPAFTDPGRHRDQLAVGLVWRHFFFGCAHGWFSLGLGIKQFRTVGRRDVYLQERPHPGRDRHGLVGNRLWREFSLGIKTNGSLWAWGNNGFGQLGLGDQVNRTTPTQTGLGRTWSKIAASRNTAAAIAADGTLWTVVKTTPATRDARIWRTIPPSPGRFRFRLGASRGRRPESRCDPERRHLLDLRHLRADGHGRRAQTLFHSPRQIALAAQTIEGVATTRLRGERLRFRGTSGLPADVRIVSGPATASAGEVSLTGTGTVLVRAWQAGDDRAWMRHRRKI